jgi:hypothetical protein
VCTVFHPLHHLSHILPRTDALRFSVKRRVAEQKLLKAKKEAAEEGKDFFANPGDERRENEGVRIAATQNEARKRRSVLGNLDLGGLDGPGVADLTTEVAEKLETQEKTIELLLSTVQQLSSQLSLVSAAVQRTDANVSKMAAGQASSAEGGVTWADKEGKGDCVDARVALD